MLCISALAALVGCRPELPQLTVGSITTIPSRTAGTLWVAADGRIWLGEPGGALVIAQDSVVDRLALPGREPLRILGEGDGRLLAMAGDSLLQIDADTGAVLASTSVAGKPMLDVRNRWVFVAAASGAVLIHEPDSLRLVSAWAALGSVSTAVTGSPEGDRIYQALAEEATATILTRDLQTGRILRTSSFPAPVSSLAADPHGNLLAVIGGEDEAAVISLRPWGDELELRWRERIAAPADAIRVRISPEGSRVAVLVRAGNQKGLRVLNAETGQSLGQLPEAPLDGTWAPDGRLLLLHPGAIHLVQ